MREFNNKELPQEETKTPIKVVMATKSTASSSSIPQFMMEEHYTFSEAAISLAKSISTAKRLRRDFAPFSNCLSQAKQILYEESMKETDNLLSQGRLQGYDVETKEGYTRTVHYTTGRFGKTNLQTLYGISELPVLHNSTRLALLIMREVHQGQDGVNHRKSQSDMIGRSRQYILIIQASEMYYNF